MQVNTSSLYSQGTPVAASATPTASVTSATQVTTAASTSDTVTLSEEARAKLAAEQTETDTAVTTLGSGWGNEPPKVQTLGSGWGNEPPK